MSSPRSADVCSVARRVFEPGVVYGYGGGLNAAHRAPCGRIEALVERRLWGENGEERKSTRKGTGAEKEARTPMRMQRPESLFRSA